MIRMVAALIAAGTLLAGCEPGGMMGGMGGGMGMEPAVPSNVAVTAPGASVSGDMEMGASM